MSAADFASLREVVQGLDGELEKARDSFFDLDVEFGKIARENLPLPITLQNDERSNRHYRDDKRDRGRSRSHRTRVRDQYQGRVKRLRIDDLNDYVESEHRRRRRRLLLEDGNPDVLNRVTSNGTKVVVTFYGKDGGKAKAGSDRERKRSKSRSREEALAEARNDVKVRERNKRMFGALFLGTLNRFREEEPAPDYLGDDEDTEKKAKREEAAKKERRESRLNKQKLICNRNEKLAEIRRLEIKKHRLYETALWMESTKPLSNYIRTSTKPHIFYQPKIPHPAMDALHEKTEQFINDTISNKFKRVTDNLHTFEKKVKEKWVDSTIHSLDFDEKNLVKEEMEQELEDIENVDVQEKNHFNPEKVLNEQPDITVQVDVQEPEPAVHFTVQLDASDIEDSKEEGEITVDKLEEEEIFTKVISNDLVVDTVIPTEPPPCEEVKTPEELHDKTTEGLSGEDREVTMSADSHNITIKRGFSSVHKKSSRKKSKGTKNEIAPSTAPKTWMGFMRTETLPALYYLPKIPFDFSKRATTATSTEIQAPTEQLPLELESLKPAMGDSVAGDEETSLEITIYNNPQDSAPQLGSAEMDGTEEGEILSGGVGDVDEDDIGDLQVTVYCNPEKAESTEMEVEEPTTPPTAEEVKSQEKTSAALINFDDEELMSIDDDIDYIIEEYVD